VRGNESPTRSRARALLSDGVERASELATRRLPVNGRKAASAAGPSRGFSRDSGDGSDRDSGDGSDRDSGDGSDRDSGDGSDRDSGDESDRDSGDGSAATLGDGSDDDVPVHDGR